MKQAASTQYFDPRPGGEAPATQRIAVIGSGISGLSAAWLLGQHHDVRVYEQDSWAGGHANTVDVDGPGGPIAVDTGFIVYNERNYPNLTALFRHLGVETRASSMSFAASLDDGGFEYSSNDIFGLVGQPSNLVSPRFWSMVRDILRFYGEARTLAQNPQWADMMLGDVLAARRYSAALVNDHVLPMCAAIWSATTEEIRAFPFASFARFFSNHGLFNVGTRPQWRTVSGGSRSYVEKLRRGLGERVLTSTGVRRVVRRPDGVTIEDVHGGRAEFDSVVVATHADQALRLLDAPSADESRLLGAFRYGDNVAVLHEDPSLMPRRRRVWSSWNYVAGAADGEGRPLCVSYWMNRLQGLDPRRPLFVTLNPVREPAPELTHRIFNYRHPLLDGAAINAQRRLWGLQGLRRTWFCGAYFGYGFHEDGLQSGLAVAEALGGVRRPWTVENESGRIHLAPALLEAAE